MKEIISIIFDIYDFDKFVLNIADAAIEIKNHKERREQNDSENREI